MSLVISKLISSAIETILFTLIPFIWWCVTARKKSNFFEWIGLKKAGTKENKSIFWVIGLSSAFMLISAFVLYLLGNVESATTDFDGLGFNAIPAILVYAILNTALPEEILFRGFLLKRIENRFNFVTGNIVQAVIFGLMHGIMFFSAVGTVKASLIIMLTGTIGWFMGVIQTKKKRMVRCCRVGVFIRLLIYFREYALLFCCLNFKNENNKLVNFDLRE